jgi:nucleoside-diphosphate-sugar epimerase
MKLLVTGATGFVGQALITRLITFDNYKVYAAVRKVVTIFPSEVCQVKFDSLSPVTGWCNHLKAMDCVIHTAARVHVMSETSTNPFEDFRYVNTKATLNLAEQAAASGVKRFIYISSIKVNGEVTLPDYPFTANDIFVPADPYALSKYEAEQGLLSLAKETEMDVVIIRPPLVYGPKVKANFLSMMKWINTGVPLPFGAIHNQRSLVALDNLVSFIIHCIDHPKAANQTFLISDGDDVSTTDLLHKVAKAFGKKTFLVPVPVSLMKFAAKLVGKAEVADRLSSSLQVDSTKARDLLGWKPVITMDAQLKKTADAYLENEKTL